LLARFGLGLRRRDRHGLSHGVARGAFDIGLDDAAARA